MITRRNDYQELVRNPIARNFLSYHHILIIWMIETFMNYL